MIKTNGKSPKRKSLAGEETGSATPKKARISNILDKSKGGGTPAKGKTPIKQQTPKTPKSVVKIASLNSTGKKSLAAKVATPPKEEVENVSEPATEPQTKNKKVKKVFDKERKSLIYRLKTNVKEKSDLPFSLKCVEERIAKISSKKEISKTALRKLKILRKFKRVLENGGEKPATVQIIKPTTGNVQNKTSKKGKKNEAIKQSKSLTGQKQAKTPKQKVIQPQKLVDEEEDDESDDDDETATKLSSQADDESGEEEAESNSGESGEEDEEASGEEDEDEEGSDDEIAEKKVSGKAQAKEATNGKVKREKPPKRLIVFVGNLPYQMTKPEIKEYFGKAGKVLEVVVPLDRETKQPRGFAFVKFENQKAIDKALLLDNTSIRGRVINVSSGYRNFGNIPKGCKPTEAQFQAAASLKQNQKGTAGKAKTKNGA